MTPKQILEELTKMKIMKDNLIKIRVQQMEEYYNKCFWEEMEIEQIKT